MFFLYKSGENLFTIYILQISILQCNITCCVIACLIMFVYAIQFCNTALILLPILPYMTVEVMSFLTLNTELVLTKTQHGILHGKFELDIEQRGIYQRTMHNLLKQISTNVRSRSIFILWCTLARDNKSTFILTYYSALILTGTNLVVAFVFAANVCYIIGK